MSSAFLLLTLGSIPTPSSSHNLTHEQRADSFVAAKQALTNKIQSRGDLPHISVKKQLELLDQLASFELGRFLIERGGLNGFWTHYVVTHPIHGRLTNLNSEGKPFYPLEAFLLNSCPTTLATQQRFSIFKAQIQQYIHEGCSMASLPSGLMADFLDLDYSECQNFSLYAIDLDPETLSQAKNYAEDKGLLPHCHFSLKDAWELDVKEEFDLLTSHGLNFYEPDDERVIALYRQFYSALKPGGVFITSFLTPPPSPGSKTGWKLDCVNMQNALLQKIIFVDILDVKWQMFRTEESVKAHLSEAGFEKIEIFYDDAHIFPTVVAKKPSCLAGV